MALRLTVTILVVTVPRVTSKPARSVLVAVGFVCLMVAFCTSAGKASAATFTRGFADDVWFDATVDHITPQEWIQKTRSTGAKLVQIEVDWTGIEPHSPARGAHTTNPAASQFHFASLDQRVEEFTGQGLQPVFLVTDAPRWAEANGGTAADYASAGYKPNPIAFGDLGEALAKRYSGSYPNPADPSKPLPRVRYMQAWAEANTDFHLSPQWTRINGRAVNTGASIYRGLLNAFYSGVKAGDRSDVVIASGLESYGDAPFQNLQRTHPVTFLENLLCLAPNLKRFACAGRGARFDVVAADPYDAAPGGPTNHAVSPLDASAPDLKRLVKVLSAARRAGTVLPNVAKPLWVTEFGYESNPPNHEAVSTATQARWLQQAFYVFWHEGVSTVLWYLVRDQSPPYSLNYASGVFFRNGKAKPSFTAYRFPFVVVAQGARSCLWGISPVTGTIDVQKRQGQSWLTVARLRGSSKRVFSHQTSALADGLYRAVVRGQKSLVWKYSAG